MIIGFWRGKILKELSVEFKRILLSVEVIKEFIIDFLFEVKILIIFQMSFTLFDFNLPSSLKICLYINLQMTLIKSSNGFKFIPQENLSLHNSLSRVK